MQTMLNTCFPSGSQEIWYLPGAGGCSCDQPRVQKPWGAKALVGLPGEKQHPRAAAFSLWWEPSWEGENAREPAELPPDSACVFPCVTWLCMLTALLRPILAHMLGPVVPRVDFRMWAVLGTWTFIYQSCKAVKS